MPEPIRQDTRESFIEYSLMLILIVIVAVALFLMAGDSIRSFVNELFRSLISVH
jgi:hypothetical protein